MAFPIIFIAILFFSVAHAEKIPSITSITPPANGQKSTSNIIIFKSEKGDISFDHDLHVREMKKESCIPCHKSENPTKTDSFSRFDIRTAHYFCKGCHREKGKGPTECFECHKAKKK